MHEPCQESHTSSRAEGLGADEFKEGGTGGGEATLKSKLAQRPEKPNYAELPAEEEERQN